PVQVFEWPRRPPRHPLLAQLAGWPGARALHGWLVAQGLLKPARDFEAYHRVLRRRGLVSRLGEPARAAPAGPPDDLERAVEAVRELFPMSPRP
ncbi:MAG: mitochondrial fission ELM1 family protein, partial [Myxococcota bacterium]